MGLWHFAGNVDCVSPAIARQQLTHGTPTMRVRSGSNPALVQYPRHFRLALASGIRKVGARRWLRSMLGWVMLFRRWRGSASESLVSRRTLPWVRRPPRQSPATFCGDHRGRHRDLLGPDQSDRGGPKNRSDFPQSAPYTRTCQVFRASAQSAAWRPPDLTPSVLDRESRKPTIRGNTLQRPHKGNMSVEGLTRKWPG